MKPYGEKYRLELSDYIECLPGNSRQIAITLFNKFGVDMKSGTLRPILSRYLRNGKIGYDKVARTYIKKEVQNEKEGRVQQV